MKSIRIFLGVAFAASLLCVVATADAHTATSMASHLAVLGGHAPGLIGMGIVGQLATSRMRRKDAAGAGDDDPEKGLKTAQAELKRIGDEIKTFAETAQKEIKDTGAMAAETKASVDKLIVEQVKAQSDFNARINELEQRAVRRIGEGSEHAKSPGQMLTESDKVKEFIANKTRGTVAVNLKALLSPNLTTDVVSGVVAPDRLPGIVPRTRQRLFIRDLISPGRTGAPAVHYVQQTGFTNLAAVVSEGVRKPESTIAFALKVANVATIAHFFKAAKQLLDDMPALQSTVDEELRYGIKFAEEREILFGDGTGMHLLGIVPQAADFDPAFTVDNQTLIDDLRLAILQAELVDLPPSGVVLHPIDWARIELSKSTQGEYLIANPLRLAGPTMWGLPIVATRALDQGDFLTGPFEGGAQIFDREDANVQIATQNEADFVENLITIRGEERLALTVKRPEGFISGSFTEELST